MITPFEEPAKTEMVSGCRIAIDLAGHDLVDPPAKIQLPETSELRGVLKGDLQSMDSEGVRYCYYVRPNEVSNLPTWLANLAEVCHEILDTKFYVVVLDTNPSFERSCKAAGAGLLLLSDDNEFQHVLDFDTTLPEAADERFAEEIKKLRAYFFSKLSLHQGELQSRFESIGELTAGMSDERASNYREGVERLHSQWTRWGEEIAKELDRVLSEKDVAGLLKLREAIDSGPLLDEDV